MKRGKKGKGFGWPPDSKPKTPDTGIISFEPAGLDWSGD